MAYYPSDPYNRGAANRDSEEEALGWVVRLSSGDATEDDHAEFVRWCDDQKNATAYRRARALWLGLRDSVLTLSDDDEMAQPLPLRKDCFQAAAMVPMASPRRKFRSRRLALAAAIILVMGGLTEYVHDWRFNLTSGPLGMRRATLADGSVVTMAPGTALNTFFENGSRHVALSRGEAFFKVRRDAAHPFVVSTDYGVVRVLGTAFSVRRNDDERVTVVVRSGRVEVRSGDQASILTPGREISFTADGLGPMRKVSAELATAWERGRLVLGDQSIAQVIQEINRYGNRRVVLLNSEAGRRRVSAVIDLAHIDSWLAALSGSQGLHRTAIGPLTILR